MACAILLHMTYDGELVHGDHSHGEGPISRVRQAPSLHPLPPDARRPTARCSAAPCLPAHSRVPVTRVRCPVHVCVDRSLPQHAERAHAAWRRHRRWATGATEIGLGCPYTAAGPSSERRSDRRCAGEGGGRASGGARRERERSRERPAATWRLVCGAVAPGPRLAVRRHARPHTATRARQLASVHPVRGS